MSNRQEFQMTEEQHTRLMEACKPVPMIALQCGTPRSSQENANDAWQTLGREMGFDGMTVEAVAGKGTQFITAEPCRRPGYLYVVLETRQDILKGGQPEHVEQFIEVEDHEKRGVGIPRSFEEGEYRLMEFPHPDFRGDVKP